VRHTLVVGDMKVSRKAHESCRETGWHREYFVPGRTRLNFGSARDFLFIARPPKGRCLFCRPAVRGRAGKNSCSIRAEDIKRSVRSGFSKEEEPRKENKMIRNAIDKIATLKGDLTYEEAYEVMTEIMTGQTTPTQNAAFLASLSTKSTKAETIDEISGCAAAMREQATKVPHPGMEVLEIVGTGGDGAHSFNISTTAAMVIAAAGIKVAKHGNRAASSLSGTADCQEALGVNIQQDVEKAQELLKDVGICFLFAQKYHSAMKYVGPIRKELGFRTVFNILGPLTNPANPDMFLLGVYDEYLVEPVAKVLDKLGVKRAFVVYGQDKMDEISASAPTTLCELKNGYYRTTVIKPEDFGLVRGTKNELVGGTPAENALITRKILSGDIQGTKRNAVLLNAGAAIYIGGKADSIEEGVKKAQELIDSGAALKKLEEYIIASNT